MNFTMHKGYDSEERIFLRRHNTLGFENLEKYRWAYADTDAFDRSANAKLRNFLITELELQNKRGKTYSVKFHDDFLGAEFDYDV